MRVCLPIVLAPLLLSAACATVPLRYQGSYIRASALAAVKNGGLFAAGDHTNLTLAAELATLESGGERRALLVVGVTGSEVDGYQLKLVERGREERFMSDGQSGVRIPDEDAHLRLDATWDLELVNGQPRLTTGEVQWVRIADALPAASGLSAASITSAALFSRGFVSDSEAWVIVGRPRPGVADLRRGSEDVWTQFRGGFDAPFGDTFGAAPLMQIGHETYLLEQRNRGIRLVPAAAGPKTRRGAEVIELSEMESPPFLVLTDRVTIHQAPSADSPVLGEFGYLTAVAPWIRSDQRQTVGGLEGHWYLVQAGAAIGWTFGTSLGQRLQPMEGPPAPPPLWEAEPVDAGLRVGFGYDRDGPVCRFETEAGSFLLQKQAPACVGSERGRCSSEGLPYWGDGDRALLLLAALNDDQRADLLCLFEKQGELAICPVLSVGEDGFAAAGCVLQPGPEAPGITAVDQNQDGHLDLSFGDGEPILFDPAIGRFAGAVEARLEASLPSRIAASAIDFQRDAEGRIVMVSLRDPRLRVIPPEIANQTLLTQLLISRSPIRALPVELTRLEHLETLQVEDGELRRIPRFVADLARLTDLDLSGNRIETFAPALLELTGLRRLDLSRNDLTNLPEEVGRLQALRTLELNGNRLRDLPASMAELNGLRTLALYGNQLDRLPEAPRSCKALEELDLSRNLITELPAWLGELTALAGLGLANNRLSALPPAIGQLTALTRLDLSGNRLTHLPASMKGLDALGEVHWEGRPCGRRASEATAAFLERCVGLPWK